MINPFDIDQLLRWVAGGYTQALRYRCDRAEWQPGQRLKLLLTGYNGARNTGADVRVAEIIRQLHHLLGRDKVDLTVTTLNPQLTMGYFQGAQQVRLPHVFPQFLYNECPQHHGVIACEGSMFKSKFADALSTMMAMSLGLAATENKLSVGYGAEAGAMNNRLSQFVQHHCRDSLILCRNRPSQRLLSEKLGIRSTGGTDTAWTFEPAPLGHGAALLKRAGWDGRCPVLAICPINPFWWPVKPSMEKWLGNHLAGLYREQHYCSLYFHHQSQVANQKYSNYIKGLAQAVNTFCQQREIFPIVVGMEQIDRQACKDLAAALDQNVPYFISDQHNMYSLVSLLRNCDLLVSSRFHAILTTMPAQVPAVGVTMDERIRNLMHEQGHHELLLDVDDPNLGEKLLPLLHRLEQDRDTVAHKIGQTVADQLQHMGHMGIAFMAEVSRIYPDFPQPQRSPTWETHLPPLSPTLTHLLENYA
ncbi:polysaccharide pyruvyl transferase family protein [Leptothoe spongobia]|uniref:Polysaccharide pyruvyl transferase family protein n=1 Tax=Leptothoe spongobia TAU-MAC 1115 TaxID=1967444 RepID=A0A947GIM6_9CYAN|nr:polysaccharide pyruvyl transferase family protein [Leptothoe spongobia]MBT9315804.1 polysaccharide pyruvyl transferase family protein [Leptothoe spongobia TAU-MAC 1115]